MKKIELEIVALSHSVSHSQNYAIILGEKDGVRRLPIVIGGFEAQSIAVALERMIPNRPLTHDLFKNTLDTFSISLKEIIISELIDGIFYAQLICTHLDQEIQIDSRTSDALALAVRFSCPIYTFENILETAGVVLEENEGDPDADPIDLKSTGSIDQLNHLSLEALEKLLEDVLAEEDYERAASIRDEINRRKKDS
jgi:uncharacterized protein